MGMIKWAGDMLRGLWTVGVGLKITFRYLFTPPVTMHYPDEKWAMPERFRGLIKCDVDACIVCDLCVKACPVSCITINWKREPGKSGKIATNFIVDYQKCIFCGLCTEPCPTFAIFHSHDYEITSTSRMPQVIDWVKPENRIKNPKAKPPAKAAAKPAPAAAPKPAAAGAPAAAPAAVATAPAPTTDRIEPLPNTAENAGKAISVWIEPGCIVCDLCEDTCPEVFEVTPETSIVLPGDRMRWPELTEKIIAAAQECPVNVIKYTLGG
jgi:NADH-quinone oxidoreductase chain I